MHVFTSRVINQDENTGHQYRILRNMVLTEEQIKKLPIIEEEEQFYNDGEFESILLADFKKDADKIDEKNAAN